jgi:hypothetical protein
MGTMRWLPFFLVACSSAPSVDPRAQVTAEDGGTVLPEAGSETSAPVVLPARYPAGALHSPMSASVVEKMRAVLAASPHKKNVFAKVGASNTVNTNFAHCFAGNDVRWEGHERFEPTRAFFSGYDRTSLAATVGWGAAAALKGEPNALEQEVAAIDPAFAVVLFGTNDTVESNVIPFERALGKVIDELLALRVVPLVSTIPPRADRETANALVPEMNAVIRVVAQSRQVPFMDLWQKLVVLPDYGLISDGIHMSVHVQGGAHGCWFGADALDEGMNIRNLVTIESLHRARSHLLEGAAPEATPPDLAGKGSWDQPLVIDALPFVDARDTKLSTEGKVASYACGTQDESGPEIVYALTLDRPRKVRARVYPDDGVDIDLHWLSSKDPASCTARADKTLEATLPAGTHYLAADTFTNKSGAFRLTVVALD